MRNDGHGDGPHDGETQPGRARSLTPRGIAPEVMFNGIGVPLAATGLVYPIWAMAAMAISVTAIFFNSLRGRPQLFFDAVLSVGRAAA